MSNYLEKKKTKNDITLIALNFKYTDKHDKFSYDRPVYIYGFSKLQSVFAKKAEYFEFPKVSQVA